MVADCHHKWGCHTGLKSDKNADKVDSETEGRVAGNCAVTETKPHDEIKSVMWNGVSPE
jgi:hypothetical protein